MLLVLVAVIAAIPRTQGVGATVSPSMPAVERSGQSARTEEVVFPTREVSLWERMLSPDNLGRALKRVESNRVRLVWMAWRRTSFVSGCTSTGGRSGRL
ncbi:hypothetical protein QTQ03_04000 [Micromonospora sp. WMMA1363]|uniref:hypothetical protein n=1 Tax=Micromonospora sp. WMMA1363 TaxID=3053985 RepID=UPI00259CDA01|nr:hypothetical protein [Micromonospora sp. WMMA1363]MDM4718797.1 hypothetical protein [Micromonospora sp. WMMA1363]